MNESSDIQISDKFADLIFFALDLGVDIVRSGGGPITPFVVIEKDGERELHNFATERLEEGQQRAREFLLASQSNVTAYALAYDGYITIEGTKFDAILIEASERGRSSGVRMAQRYVPKKFLRKFKTVGNPALLGECETLLN